MSTKHATLGSAVVTALQRTNQAEPAALGDASADSILSFQREFKHADVEDIGRIYFFDPPSVIEIEASRKHMRYDEHGASISMLGMVDGAIARIRRKDRLPMFSAGDRDRLLKLPAERLTALWQAIGGDSGRPLSEDMVLAAEKK